MKKSLLLEKIGKITVSFFLTGLLVSWIVLAWTTWQTYNDGDQVTWTEWSKMVDIINAKISLSDLTGYYTQAEVDNLIANITSEPQILPSLKQYATTMWSGEKTKNLSCSSWEQVMSCGFTKTFKRDEDSVYCNLDITNNRCNFHQDQSDGYDGATWYCYCAYFKNWSWDNGVNVSYTSSCGASKLSTTKASWACQPWAVNYYYTWESTCTYIVSRMWSDGEEIIYPESGYKYSGKKKQTCN